MPFFETTRFQGELSGHGHSVPIGFDLTIDDSGILQLMLDRMPFSREAYALYVQQRPGASVDLIRLEGRSGAGHAFHSDSFHIVQFSHGSEAGRELCYQGDCYDAELELPPSDNGYEQRDSRVWLVRQFRIFPRITRDTLLGRVVIGGPRQERDTQDPNGFLAITHRDGDASDDWWAESERFLTHVARVLSFACDTYLRPVIERRFHSGGTTVRMVRQGRASPPFLAPFHELHMEPIFACACNSYFDLHGEVEELDAAIRWLTAPVAYDESRLVNAMSALENILDRCGLEQIDTFMGASAFKRVARQVRELLRETGVPEGMEGKVAELNRLSLSEKVKVLIRARSIATGDMPKNWLATVIRQRNIIVHTGVSGDAGAHEPDTLVQTIWVRELVTRIILERLGFVGAYRSWLHHDEQYHFPECVPMEAWVGAQEGAASTYD